MAINYWCPNSENRTKCSLCNRRGDFQLNERIENLSCDVDDSVKVKIVGETAFMTMTDDKMTPQQVQKERQARSTQHFKKEILPTLGKDEQRHFSKKFGKNSNNR